MQVMPIVLLLIVATISYCHENNNTSITSQTETDHRKLPLFPRISIKFMVNSRKIEKKANIVQEKTTKKPLMPKIIPTTKVEVNISNRGTVTRKPLMKKINFTVKTTNRRPQKSDDDQNFTNKNHEVNSNNSGTKARSNELKQEIRIFARTGAKDNEQPKIVASTTVNYFAEEHKDRKEFIFLNSTNDEKVTVHDLLQIDEGEIETTTATVDVKENLRPKRSFNIIEEEYIVTAIPSRKYTDHDVKLNNDRFFKNVNT